MRYRRVLDVFDELQAMAVGDQRIGDFLRRDDTVLARMAAAIDVIEAAGLHVEPGDDRAAQLRRAVKWQRHSRRPDRPAPPVRRGHRPGIAAVVVAGRRCAVSESAHEDPVARVDALVGAIGPRLSAPGVQRREVVLVTGPGWRRHRCGGGAARAAARAHVRRVGGFGGRRGPAGGGVRRLRGRRADSVRLCAARCGGRRYRPGDRGSVQDRCAPQVARHDHSRPRRADRACDALPQRAVGGVAAAPQAGEPRVDDLVAEVQKQLADTDLVRRNRLRAWESRLQAIAGRYERDAEGVGRQARVAALREERTAVLRQRRLSKSERTIALRSQIQQARVQLSYFARNRCASVRSELQEDAAGLTRRKLPEFETYARERFSDVVAEVNDGSSRHLTDVVAVLGLAVELPPP
ncbi:hypothetical protein I553_8243 [Mycobacterium xenopi 4042]|uniref:Uncharacterized protein n=1 Tax=Mycobacterium xenopi 4042 TaxID=1299334 RepID=X8BJ71_MYCXE|nr:hypothetical protein I553_8243 [Mycobacterium xenopi 4042]